MRVLSRLFRRLFIEGLIALHREGELTFFGGLTGLSEPQAFEAYLAPLRKTEWVVYAKSPFGGPEAVLAYLSRYTHRVAISNSRIISADANTAAFCWKDYRIKNRDRQKVMRLTTSEFIRRFLIHVLPDGFHRIWHNGLLASSRRKINIAKMRILLGVETTKQDDPPAAEVIPLTLRNHAGLRRRDAHDRDFQAGTKTTNPSAAPKGRRMTRCTPNRSALIPNRASFREGLRFVSSTRNTENSLAQAVNEAQSVPSKPSIPPHSHLPGPRRPNMTRSNLMLSP